MMTLDLVREQTLCRGVPAIVTYYQAEVYRSNKPVVETYMTPATQNQGSNGW